MEEMQSFRQMLQLLEVEKRVLEERLTERLRSLENESEQLKEQLQEQDQLLQQQDRHLQKQGQQLRQQEEQLQQQGEQLKEYESQMDAQDQQLQQHKLLLDELVLHQREQPPKALSPVEPPPLLSGLATCGSLAGSSGDRPGIAALREGFSQALLQVPLDGLSAPASKNPQPKKGLFWEKVVELCEEQKYLEAYKLVIAEPEESCLLRLMQLTGPTVERLDAESNSRLIRRLIHILSSPAKEPGATCIEHIFSWLWQALDVGIHFTTSQVEDLAAALQKVAAPNSTLSPSERADAGRLLLRVSALRRI